MSHRQVITPEDKAFGRRLRALRDRLFMSQEELARRAGVSRVYISYLESGRNAPSLDVSRRLARSLEVTLEKLCGEEKR